MFGLADFRGSDAVGVDTHSNGIRISSLLGREAVISLRAIALIYQNRLGAGLPIRNLLLGINADCNNRSITQIVGNDFRISGADVGDVGRLTALLELACENRDCDSNQHGLELLIPLRSLFVSAFHS